MWLANALLIKRKKDPSDLAATLAFRFVLSICSFVGWFHFIYAHVASFLPIIGIFSILFASIRCYRIANFNTYLVSLIHNSISFRCVSNRISFIFPILECFHPRLRFHVFLFSNSFCYWWRGNVDVWNWGKEEANPCVPSATNKSFSRFSVFSLWVCPMVHILFLLLLSFFHPSLQCVFIIFAV